MDSPRPGEPQPLLTMIASGSVCTFWLSVKFTFISIAEVEQPFHTPPGLELPSRAAGTAAALRRSFSCPGRIFPAALKLSSRHPAERRHSRASEQKARARYSDPRRPPTRPEPMPGAFLVRSDPGGTTAPMPGAFLDEDCVPTVHAINIDRKINARERRVAHIIGCIKDAGAETESRPRNPAAQRRHDFDFRRWPSLRCSPLVWAPRCPPRPPPTPPSPLPRPPPPAAPCFQDELPRPPAKNPRPRAARARARRGPDLAAAPFAAARSEWGIRGQGSAARRRLRRDMNLAAAQS
jgi:hypothetical protein